MMLKLQGFCEEVETVIKTKNVLRGAVMHERTEECYSQVSYCDCNSYPACFC